MSKQNPALKGGARSVGDLLGGDLEQNKPSPFPLQVSQESNLSLQDASYRVNRQLENSYLSSANGRAEEKECALREFGYVPPEGGAA